MIIVLNKIDLVPAPLVLAWQEYFKNHFPMLKVMCFASYAGMILKEGKRGKYKLILSNYEVFKFFLQFFSMQFWNFIFILCFNDKIFL